MLYEVITNTGADRFVLVVQQHGGIAVEPDQRAIAPAHAGTGAHDDGVINLALLSYNFV